MWPPWSRGFDGSLLAQRGDSGRGPPASPTETEVSAAGRGSVSAPSLLADSPCSPVSAPSLPSTALLRQEEEEPMTLTPASLSTSATAVVATTNAAAGTAVPAGTVGEGKEDHKRVCHGDEVAEFAAAVVGSRGIVFAASKPRLTVQASNDDCPGSALALLACGCSCGSAPGTISEKKLCSITLASDSFPSSAFATAASTASMTVEREGDGEGDGVGGHSIRGGGLWRCEVNGVHDEVLEESNASAAAAATAVETPSAVAALGTPSTTEEPRRVGPERRGQRRDSFSPLLRLQRL